MSRSAADVSAVAVEPVVGTMPGCAVCSHPRALHDHIATRFCAATASSALSRGCVCPVPPGS